MKIKDGYMLREVAGSYIVVPIGEESLDFSGVISLNETGAMLWKKMEKETSKEKIIEEMLKKYDVERSIVEADIEEFIAKLKGADLIE